MGKVGIYNADGDEQFADVYLRSGNGDPIDKTHVRIPDGVTTPITVQGTFVSSQSGVVQLVCATYDGYAGDASLIAIEVDSIHQV